MIVLLHGLGGTGEEWSQTTAWLAGRGWRVAAPDLSPDAQAADVVRVIEEPAVVVGQSLGGNTAMLAAAAHPELVRGPALVVRAERGMLSAAEAEEMARRKPGTRIVEIADAGHDVHLDQPDAWHAALGAFLDAL